MTRTTATACVTLTVEVDVGSAWGPECTVAQAHRQAAEEAPHKLQRVLEKAGAAGTVRIVGVPKITAVIVEREP